MSTTCYRHSGPNPVVLLDHRPCNSSAGSISLCCEMGQTCLPNGLCATQSGVESGVYYSGGCTDSTYQAPICPKFCTSGDANWVVECPSGTAVKEGDFCCSVSGTARTCCDTASNGLGLVAPVSSAQPTSATFVETSTVPASVCNGATTPSSQRIDGPSMPSSTPHFNLDLSKRLPGNVPTFTYTVTLAFFAIVISCAFVFGIIYFVLWNETPSTWTKVKGMIKHTFNRLTARLQRRQLGTINNDNYFAMNNFRDQSDGTSGSQAPVEPTERGISSEAEGSQANPAETNADGTPDPWLSAAPDSNLPTVPPPAATS